jgi:acyl-coenzyme A synthetase/AMP-(fatty) acid ligase
MWSADGFTLLGRTDRIVKIEGKRVALAEVEQALAASPWSGPPLPWRCLASGP